MQPDDNEASLRHGSRWGVAITAVVVGAITAGAIWIAISRSRPTFDEDDRRLARAAARVFEQQDKIPVTDRAAVANAIRNAKPIPNQSHAVEPPDEVRAQLADFIAGWFEARADGDPETYARWALAQGYRLSAEDPAWLERKRSLLESMWPGYTTEPFPDPFDPRAVFDTFYRGSMRQEGGAIHPGYVANNPVIVFRQMRVDMPDPFPLPLDMWDGLDLWVNWTTAGDTNHWAPGVAYNDVLQRHREALTGIVNVAVKSAARELWTPYTLTCYFDPDARQWRLLQASTSNVIYPHVQVER